MDTAGIARCIYIGLYGVIIHSYYNTRQRIAISILYKAPGSIYNTMCLFSYYFLDSDNPATGIQKIPDLLLQCRPVAGIFCF